MKNTILKIQFRWNGQMTEQIKGNIFRLWVGGWRHEEEEELQIDRLMKRER